VDINIEKLIIELKKKQEQIEEDYCSSIKFDTVNEYMSVYNAIQVLLDNIWVLNTK